MPAKNKSKHNLKGVWKKLLSVCKFAVVTAILAISFSTTAPAASGVPWVATTSTNCLSQSNISGAANVDIGGLLYSFPTDSTFQKYNPTTATCTTLAAPPDYSSSYTLSKLNNSNLIFAPNSQGSQIYHIPSNQWIAFFPRMKARDTNYSPARQDGATQGVGNTITEYNGELYILAGNGTTFQKYNPTTNVWTNLAVAPAAVNSGSTLTTLGTTIYATRGGGNTDFWSYDISGNIWTNLALTNPVPAAAAAGASMANDGTYVYLLEGNNTAKFYRYNPAASSGSRWTTLANAPNAVYGGGALTKLNSTTLYALEGNNTKNFWKYDITSNTWNPGGVTPAKLKYRENPGATLSSDGTYLYATTGGTRRDFLRYTPASDSWEHLKNTPIYIGNSTSLPTALGGAIYSSTLNDIYLVSGLGVTGINYSSVSTSTLIVRYALSGTYANTWPIYLAPGVNSTTSFGTQGMASTLPGVSSFDSTGDFTYTLRGNGAQELFRFSTSILNWILAYRSRLADGSFIDQDFGNTAAIIQGDGNRVIEVNGDLYMLPGYPNAGTGFYRFSPTLNQWTVLENTPNYVYDNSIFIKYDNNTIYLQNYGYMFKYNIATNEWTGGSVMGQDDNGATYSQDGPAVGNLSSPNSGSNMVSAGSHLYVGPGGSYTTWYSFTPSSNTWVNLATLPFTAGNGAATTKVDLGNSVYDIYFLQGNSAKGFAKYNTDTNTWTTTLASLPTGAGNVTYGGALNYPGSGDYIFALIGGNTTQSWRYSISGNSWTQLTAIPGGVQTGGSLTNIGADLYAFRGGDTADFWVSHDAGNTWITLTASLEPISNGGSLTTDTRGTSSITTDDVIYATSGKGHNYLLKYTPGTDSWAYADGSPQVFGYYSADLTRTGGSIAYSTYDNDLYAMPGYGRPLDTTPSPSNGTFFRYKLSAGTNQYRWIYDNGTEFWTAAGTSAGAWAAKTPLGNLFYEITNGVFASYYPGIGEWNFFTKNLLASGSPMRNKGFITSNLDGNSTTVEVGGKFYQSSGFQSSNSGRDFMLFDPATNTWRSLAPLPYIPGGGCNTDTSMINLPTDSDTIYLISGRCSTGQNFFKYTISTNLWTALATTPTMTSNGMPNLAYPGAGDWIYCSIDSSNTNLWRYSLSKNLWVTYNLPHFDGSVAGGIDPTPIADDSTSFQQGNGNSLVIANSKIYTLPGAGLSNFRKFDPSTNSWTTLTSLPATASYGTGLVWDGNNIIYATNGANFYAYCLDSSGGCTVNGNSVGANTWTTLATPPVTISIGAMAIAPGSDLVFVLPADGTTHFYRYCTAASTGTCANGQTGNTWASAASTTSTNYSGAALVAFNSNTIYAVSSYFTTNTFQSYSISANAWTTLENTPDYVGYATSLTTDGTYVYATKGRFTNTFWRYNPGATSGSHWSTLANLPMPIGSTSGGGIAYLSGTIWLVPGYGYSTHNGAASNGVAALYRYNVANDQWTYFAAPVGWGFGRAYGSPVTSYGDDSYLYEFNDDITDSFSRYTISPSRTSADPDAGSWTTMSPFPATVDGGSMATVAGTNDLYATRGYGTKTFTRFDRTLTRKARLRTGFSITTDIPTWDRVKNGTFKITIDGVVRNLSGLNFTSANSLSDVANILQTGIRAVTGSNDVVTYCNDGLGPYFIFESPTAAGSGSVTNFTYLRGAAPATLTGGTNVNSTTVSTFWAPITNGSFSVTLNGGSPTIVTAINFTGNTTMAQVASTIQTRLNALAPPPTGGSNSVVTWTGSRFTITATTNNLTSNITILSSAGSGTDISGATFMDASTNGVVTPVEVDLSHNTAPYDPAGAPSWTDGYYYQTRPTTTTGDWLYCNDSNIPPSTPVTIAATYSGMGDDPLMYSPTLNEIWLAPNFFGTYRNIPGGASRLYRYVPNATGDHQGQWPTTALLPNPPNATAGGSSLVAADENKLYAFRGNNTADFWRFNIASNLWTDLTSTKPAPGLINSGASLTTNGTGTIYASQGGNSNAIWKFDASTETWNSGGVPAASPVVIGNTVSTGSARGGLQYYNNSLWMVPGYSTTAQTYVGPSVNPLFRYDIATDSWPGVGPAAANTSATGGFQGGSKLTSLNNNEIYAIEGSSSTANHNFWRYTVNTNTWDQRADMTQIGSGTIADVEAGGSVAAGCFSQCAVFDKIFALRGKATTDFQIYNPSANTWSNSTTQLFPVVVGTASIASNQGGLIYNTADSKLYGLSGTNAIVYVLDTNTRLSIESINGGNPVYNNTAFTVQVKTVDASGTPINVTADTQATLQLVTGTGVLGGTFSGTILAGQNSVTISGVTYTVNESVTIKAIDSTFPTPPVPATTSANSTFTILGLPAVVDSITPNRGASTGFTSVTLAGSNFLSTDSVTFNGHPVLNFTYNNSNSITVVTPPSGGQLNPINVTVTHLDGGVTTVTNGYTYMLPEIDNFTPNIGTTLGGTSVNIVGQYFSNKYYQMPVTVTNPMTSTVLPAGFQVKLTINTAALISAGKMQNYCTDLRFLDTDQITPLNYYIESGCSTSGGSTSTIVWVKLSTAIAATGNAIIYEIYGLPTLTSSTSNGDNTFLFFDDFEGGTNGNQVNSSKWTDTGSTGGDGAPHWIYDTSTANQGTVSSRPKALSGSGIASRYIVSKNITVPNSQTAVTDLHWKVTSENGYDYLYYCYSGDGSIPGCSRTLNFINRISGSVPAFIAELNTTTRLSSGSLNRVKFAYERDSSGTVAPDAGWIDDVKVRLFAATDPTASAGTETPKNLNVQFDPGGQPTTVAPTFNSSTSLTVITPAHSVGNVSVIATNPDGQSSIPSVSYTYSGPVITSITPNFGPTAGGTNVTINGTYFVANTNDGYNRQITISNSSSTLTNYAVPITLDTASLISAKMRSDCGDLRVKGIDGTTDISYWIESGCNTSSTIVWAKVPSITGGTVPTPGITTIYITYGHPTLTSQSNLTNIFSALVGSNLKLWLKANAGTGQTVDGTAVTTWTDQSGSSNNAVQATGSKQPLYKVNQINNLPAVQFAASTAQTMSVSANFGIPFTSIYVSKQTGGTNGRVLTGLGGNWLLGYYGGSKDAFYAEGWVNSGSASDTNWHLYEGTGLGTSGAVSTLYGNGSLLASNSGGSSGPTGGYYLNGYQGSSQLSDALITEVLHFNTVLGTSDRTQVETYLNQKYRLYNTSSLPTTSLGIENNSLTPWGQVTFDGTTATNIIAVNSTTITATSPAHALGTVNVVVTNPDAVASTQTGNYLYTNPFSNANSTFVGSPTSVMADGTEYSDLTATIKDASNQLLPGKVIQLSKISGAAAPDFSSVDCTTFSVIDNAAPILTTTDSNGKACFRTTSNTYGTAVFKVTNITDANQDLSQQATITYNELLTDPTKSSFTVTASSVASDGTAYATAQIILHNTADQPQPGKTANVTAGTGTTVTPVLCADSDATVAGTSDSAGQICYQISSGSRQNISITATVNGTNIALNPPANSISFGLPFADPSASTVEVRNQYIEPINGAAYDFAKYSGYNASYLKATIMDSTATVLPNRQVYLNSEITGAFTVHQVDCDNPVQVITANDQTDSFGRACFLIYKDSALGSTTSNTSITVSVDEANDPDTTLNSHPSITTASLANLNLFDFRFRNDDGNEMTATPVDDTNVPYYNLDPANHFRLRMNMSRVNNFNLFQDNTLNNLTENVDELSPITTSDIGPRPLPIFGEGFNATQDFRAFTSMAVNTVTHTLYVPTVDNTDSAIRVYKYDTNDISQSPTHFDISISGSCGAPIGFIPRANAQTISGGLCGTVTNVFIDSTNNLMYFVFSPVSGSIIISGASVKIYKVDLNSETVVNVLTQTFGNDFLPASHDAEIDLTHGFMYVTVSGSAVGTSYAHVIKIKLNGPTQATTEVGVLNIANTTDPINASVIDTTNQFLYLTYGRTNTKIAKIDLNVDATLPPVKVDEIDLVANPDQSPSQMVGEQSAVIDTVNGYAYFGSSTDPLLEQSSALTKAFITKVDIDPNRNFEVVARLQTSDPSFSTTDTLNGAEDFGVDPSIGHAGTAAQIDVVNQYAYFIATHQNMTIGYPVYKVYRVDLANFSHDNNYDELNYASPNTQSIKANVFVPSLGKGFIIRNHLDGDQVTEYNAATRTNFRLQSAPNIDSTYCNQINDSNYVWSSLPNSDFTIQSSTNLVDGDPTSNVSGLLSDNNETFVPGEVRDTASSTSTILLGRKNFTEVEYSLKATSGAKGSYCFRMIDNDSQNNHQTGANPNYISGREPIDFTAQNTNYYAPLTIDGVVISKNSVNVVEGVTTDNYGVKLASQPTHNVTVNILADDNRLKLTPDATPTSPTQTFLTFTTQNWDTNQYVTVTAAANSTIDGTTTAIIHHTTTSTDPAYNNIFVRPVSTSTTDYGATTSSVTANVSGEVTMTPPGDFDFPNAVTGQNTPNFSPDLSLSIEDTRGTLADYTVTLQATPFCKSPGICIPLDKVYLTSSDLVNSLNTFDAAHIGEFIANYLQGGQSLTDRSTYVHGNSADDRPLSTPITLIDTRAVPSGNGSNPLQGLLTFTLHLMIDYANIPTLELGTYTTTLTFDLNSTP